MLATAAGGKAVEASYERVIWTLSRGALALGWHARGDAHPTLCVTPPSAHRVATPLKTEVASEWPLEKRKKKAYGAADVPGAEPTRRARGAHAPRKHVPAPTGHRVAREVAGVLAVGVHLLGQGVHGGGLAV